MSFGAVAAAPTDFLGRSGHSRSGTDWRSKVRRSPADATHLQHGALKSLTLLDRKRFPEPQVACSSHAGIANQPNAGSKPAQQPRPGVASRDRPTIAFKINGRFKNWWQVDIPDAEFLNAQIWNWR